MAYNKPLPAITRLSRPFWEGSLKQEFRLQRCTQCGHHWFPPQPNCSRCLSAAYEWVPSSGRGRVWSWVVMHQLYIKEFEQDLPYNVAMVQLEEGPLVMSTVVGIPNDQIRCDLPVEALFEPVTDEMALPKFRAAAP